MFQDYLGDNHLEIRMLSPHRRKILCGNNNPVQKSQLCSLINRINDIELKRSQEKTILNFNCRYVSSTGLGYIFGSWRINENHESKRCDHHQDMEVISKARCSQLGQFKGNKVSTYVKEIVYTVEGPRRRLMKS